MPGFDGCGSVQVRKKQQTLKLHYNLVRAVLAALGEIIDDNRPADRVLERVLREDPRRGARDRRFIAETTYDIVRWKRLFQEISGSDQPAAWMATWLIWREFDIPDWPLFENVRRQSILNGLNKEWPRSVRESIPEWLDRQGEVELGTRWSAELAALNTPADVVLRANTLRTDVVGLIDALADSGVGARKLNGFPDAVVLDKRVNVFQTDAFRQGLFEVQDAGSQMISTFLEVKPGMRVVDACAGAGGKTLHLSALLQNTGRIIALDTSEWKLAELRKRARRAGATNIETRLIESSKVIKRLAGTADALLLDVPCSGLGVLRRNPDTKWKLSSESLDATRKLQSEILGNYSAMTAAGGKMVYATCSILPSENQLQVQAFLAGQQEFGLHEDHTLLPSGGTDGFYMARMSKALKS